MKGVDGVNKIDCPSMMVSDRSLRCPTGTVFMPDMIYVSSAAQYPGTRVVIDT